ncbi:uncharacterized protein LOC128242741 isoform X1 [Mya arenaria]|uniref:uncharacterized protein LOC128242741 isoform X1 n=2 Tax=Mya arenaria TaxID=6604 RepID=UPI0022E376C1|nr:uncharacterized protein LOC128242741 isoform X1 [Mya arenaria]
MSVLQVYLSWANSVLSGRGGGLSCPKVGTIQEGKVICQLIDTLCPDVDLQEKAEQGGTPTPQNYLRTALDHMRSHGIKFHFTPQDWKKWLQNILDGDIKSILDVLWLIILNYSVHSIGSSPYQRSVGIGKKLLLDWCQRELNEEFDPQSTLSYNLCTGDWFLKLLARNSDCPLNDNLEREQNLRTQLGAIEAKYGIKQTLINPADITEGTVDEHTLMIYISLLRLKIGDTVDCLKSPSDISFHSSEKSQLDESVDSKPKDVPAIILSQVSEERTRSPDDSLPVLEPVQSSPKTGSSNSSPTHSPPRKRSPETDPETSDWMSQSSGSPISSFHDRIHEPHTPEVSLEADYLIKETISKQVEEAFRPRPEGMQNPDSPSSHGSRIPVRVKDDEPQRLNGSPSRLEGEMNKEQSVSSRKITIKVQRPRSPNSIMAEARARQEQERERKKREKGEQEKLRERERDEPVMTGSASEGGDISESGIRPRHTFDTEPVKSDEEDLVRPKPNVPIFSQINGDGVPVFVMPGKKHDMELLLEALRHARTEASVNDQLIQSGPSDDPEFRKVVDKNIEQLEAQLAAVKAQSKELFDEDAVSHKEESRGRTMRKESPPSRRSAGRSPPRGILDVMANQNIEHEETSPKVVDEDRERSSPHGILRNRLRSPTDHVRRYNTDRERVREGSHSPDKRPRSPFQNGLDMDGEQDADKRLIKFLTNEIENMKLKMAVLEQKSDRKERAQSPFSVGPRVSSGLPDRERDRSPAQISSRARARMSEYGEGYSPVRRPRSTDLIGEMRSRSPRFDSPPRTSSRSPTRSPVSMFRSRTPDFNARERSRALSPSARVLSLQDLSTSINDDIDGNLTFSPASGARPVNLGYSSPIRKVNDEIWGYGQTDEEYYADTAKYEEWKKLISREACTDEDNLELKQALASALVELNIVQAKLKNANSDIKNKMAKTNDVLNDCRAQISKSQAENADLRSQIEREKSKAESQDLRIREMEKNLHEAKTTQDDKSLELEESVITLKGIVDLDKSQMSHLEDDNDKLRKRISEFQRENIKLREISSYALKDFNELKIYNDKAQTTIKDLRSCLEDARTERAQLVAEVKKLKEQDTNHKINSIVNGYTEKGLYEAAEKDHMVERSRSRSVSPSPARFAQRSSSPVMSRSITPMRSFSPVRIAEPSYPTYTPMSRSQTPTPSSCSYDDVLPGFKDGHEIYPHRRTLSYVKKFGSTNDVSSSQVDLDDPELQEFLKPRAKFGYDLDNDNQLAEESGHFAKRKLLYSPYMDKDFKPKSQQNGYVIEMDKPLPESKHPYQHTSQQRLSLEEEIESKKFMMALDSAVKQTPAQLAQQRFLQELDHSATDEQPSPDRWRSPSRGILKNTKSAHNMSIKENMPLRSVESRSYSPSVRTGKSYSPDRTPRSFTPNTRSYTSQSPVSRSYGSPTAHSAQSRSFSPATDRNRSQSPRNVGQRSFSPGSRSYSPNDNYRGNTIRDSGYSTPTSSNNRYRVNNRPRTPTRQNEGKKPTGLLSDEERRHEVINIQECYKKSHCNEPSDLWC